jgi:2,4-diketo-3-deoxy-L-fuconate hydrolase
MRFVRFSSRGSTRFGLLDGDSVRAFPETVADVPAYLALDEAARRALAPGEPIPLADVALLAPVRPHKNVFCVGRNYMGHAEEVARARNVPLNLPTVPTFFTKAPTAIVDPGADIHLSAAISDQWDWEAELAVVIGVRCRDVAEADAPVPQRRDGAGPSEGPPPVV